MLSSFRNAKHKRKTYHSAVVEIVSNATCQITYKQLKCHCEGQWMQEISDRSEGVKEEVKEGEKERLKFTSTARTCKAVKLSFNYGWVEKAVSLLLQNGILPHTRTKTHKCFSFQRGTNWSTFQETASLKFVLYTTFMSWVYKYQQFKN